MITYGVYNDKCLWKLEKNTSREEFMSILTHHEKIAVIVGNFNYQTQNGEFS